MVYRAPISVVLPAYNGQRFIGAAIESVRTQTLPVSEIIVVDDGSTDSTAAIARSLGAIVIQQSNRGVSAARNTGINAASHSWIAFIDQDDTWQPWKIERQWAAIDRYPDVGAVTCDLVWLNEASTTDKPTPTLPDETSSDGSDLAVTYFARVAPALPLSRTADYTSSLLVRRDVLISIGLFDERLWQNEDLECFLRVVARCPLAVVQERLVRRRMHGDNVSLVDPDGAAATFEHILDWMHEHPDRYPPGAARAYDQVEARRLISQGRMLLTNGKRQEARDFFKQSLGRNRSMRAVAFWCLTFLRPEAANLMLAAKRKFFVAIKLS